MSICPRGWYSEHCTDTQIQVRVYVVARHSKAVKAETQTFVPAAVSYLYVLGSGGHTTEMIDLIKLTWKPNEFAHRRYIITPDDTTSKLRKRELERLIGMADNGLSAGTHDTFLVNRTRDVHETFLSSIRSTLRCFGQVIDALTQTPAKRVLDSPTDAYKHPHVIVTNGPGTGFIVALVAFTLKVLYLAPADRMQVLYFESWARTHNLGVTGKLFHWLSPLVSLFAVQNDTLAKKFGKPNIGNINAMLAKLPRPATASGTAEAPGLSPFEAASHDEVSDEAVALSNVSRGYNSRADISPNQAPHDNLSHIYVFHRSY